MKADLDGDGVPETVSYDDGHGVCKVAPHLGAILGGNDLSAPFAPHGLVNSQGMHRVRIPGRTGDLVLVAETQPRGGFQAHLFGYAKGVFQELTAQGPLFPFVATDVRGSALMAICTPDGFDVTTGALHSSSAAAPFWQVARTSFTVTGNVVSKGALRVIARNVSEAQLRSRYPGLVSNQLFENCL